MILWHLPVSHYSEKVRWALHYKGLQARWRAPLPGAHIAVAAWLTRGRHATLPILQLDGEAIGDSTAIIAALEERHPDPPLYPADAEQRRRALDLEDYFDEQLGAHLRRLAFHDMRSDDEALAAAGAKSAPALFDRLGGAAVAYARAFTAVRYGTRPDDAAEESRAKVLEGLDRIEAELGEREYLVGDRFTVADLTAAAMLYPLVQPPEATVQLERLPASYAAFRDSVSGRRAYRYAREMFRRHRVGECSSDRSPTTTSAVPPT